MKWPVKKLDDLTEILSGFAFDSQFFNSESGHKITRIRDVMRGYSETFYSGNFDDRYFIKEGDFLIGMDGEFNIAKWGEEPALLNQRVCKITVTNSQLDKNYLFHFLPKQLKKIEDATPFVTVKHLSVKKINDIQIPLPPLAEQKRIAELLDTADRILHLRESAIAKLDELAQSVFADLIKTATSAIILEKLVVKRKVVERNEEQVWSLSLDQIEANTGRLLKKQFVPRNELGTSTFYFEPDVLLYSKLRPYLNKVLLPYDSGYATTELVPLYCDKRKVLPQYLQMALMSKNFVEYASTNSAGAKMSRVMMDKFWKYEVPLVGIEQQQEFVKFIAHLNSCKEKFTSFSKNQANLFESLQHQSFAIN